MAEKKIVWLKLRAEGCRPRQPAQRQNPNDRLVRALGGFSAALKGPPYNHSSAAADAPRSLPAAIPARAVRPRVRARVGRFATNKFTNAIAFDHRAHGFQVRRRRSAEDQRHPFGSRSLLDCRVCPDDEGSMDREVRRRGESRSGDRIELINESDDPIVTFRKAALPSSRGRDQAPPFRRRVTPM